jgi:hypothetical protein
MRCGKRLLEAEKRSGSDQKTLLRLLDSVINARKASK